MPDRIIEACEACFEANKADCSGFARAVASRVGVTLQGVADEIVESLRTSPDWIPLSDGVASAQSANNGKLVMAGLKGAEQAHPNAHGHVVVVVSGSLAHNAYPTAYWGSLGGDPGKEKTLNFAWTAEDRDRVSYAAHNLPTDSQEQPNDA